MKKYTYFLSLFVILFTSAAYAQSRGFVWKFEEVRPINKINKKMYYLKMSSGDLVVSSAYHASELQPLLSYFSIKSLEELQGKSFYSPEKNASDALDLLKIQIINKFKYTPPSPEELYDRAARALAEMRVPDFSKYLKKDVANAFSQAFDEFEVRPEWFNSFNARVKKYSKGRIELQKADKTDFRIQVKGPAAYLLLISKKSGEKMRVILGPYEVPIMFDNDN